jgi:hypothetical protein
MRIIRFPKTIKIELPDHLRQALDVILELQPEIRSDNELLLRVVAEGIATVLEHEKDRAEPHATVQTVAERMERRLEQIAKDAKGLPTKATVTSSLRPFPRSTRRYKDPGKQHVENYVGVPLDGELQKRLQEFIDVHPDEDLERFVARLIDLGLDQAEQDPGALKPNPAEVFDGTTNTTKVAARSKTVALAFAIKDRLRHKLQAFIHAHPDVIPGDEAIHMLLVLGLDRARDRP